jgi:hypothetical protein
MDNMTRIKRMSGRLEKVAWLLFWLAPLGCALFWLFFNEFPEIMKQQHGMVKRDYLPLFVRLLCFCATLPATAAAMYSMRALRALFRLYARGEVFSGRNVACYRKLGLSLLYWSGAVFLQTPLLSLAMSVGMPPGQRQLTVALGSVELATLFAGLIALLISWVMDEGRRIEEEQSLTI